MCETQLEYLASGVRPDPALTFANTQEATTVSDSGSQINFYFHCTQYNLMEEILSRFLRHSF